MKKRKFRRSGYDPAESKHRFCDPGACHCCEDRGGGNFYCRWHKVMVVQNWQNTPDERICKRTADPPGRGRNNESNTPWGCK